MACSEDPAALVAALNDMIFETKIRTTADGLDVRCVSMRDPENINALLQKHSPRLLLVDLNTLGAAAIDVVRAGCGHPSHPFVLAFVSHVDERLAKEAASAGAHLVVPRSRFSADLPAIIREHCCKPG